MTGLWVVIFLSGVILGMALAVLLTWPQLRRTYYRRKGVPPAEL